MSTDLGLSPVDRKIDYLSKPSTQGIADCMRYVSETFDNALLITEDLRKSSGMTVDDRLLVAVYDRLNAEMQARQVDAPGMPPRGGVDGMGSL